MNELFIYMNIDLYDFMKVNRSIYLNMEQQNKFV